MKINATCTARPISSGVVPSGMPAVQGFDCGSRNSGVRLAPTHVSLLEQGSAWVTGTDGDYFGTDAAPVSGPAPRKQRMFAHLGIRTTSPPV